MARVAADATAFAHRRSRMMINVAAIYDPSTSERSEHADWVRGLSAGLDDGDPGAYAGLLADEGEQRVRAAYPGATWERLAAVKATYDPDNVFRLNQNIPPGACGRPRPRRSRHGGGRLFAIGDVGLDGEAADVRRQRIEPVLAARGERDGRTLLGERARRRFADAAARAGEEGDGVPQCHGHAADFSIRPSVAAVGA